MTTKPREIARLERRAKALELRKAGAEYREIGDALGVTYQAAHQLVTKQLRDIKAKSAEDAEELRTVTLLRLNRLLRSLWKDAMAGEPKAVDSALRVIDRICKLEGLDAAHRVDLRGEIASFTLRLGDDAS